MRILVIALATSCLALGGCAICASPYDDHYSAFGGRWERDIDNHGRVGSAFTQAGYRVDEAGEEVGNEAMEPPLGQPGETNELQTISYSMPYDESLEGVDESQVEEDLGEDLDEEFDEQE